jgi:hypothetical protein
MFNAVKTWFAHIYALAVDIGPRGSTTDGERQGAEYCRQTLASLGYTAQVEVFSSARSIFEPHLLAASGMLIAFAAYPLAGRLSAVIAAMLSLAALGSDLLELSFRDNPLRWLVSKGSSQNVIATAPAGEEHRQDLVLIGHIDTQRTPLIFSSKRWLAAYKAFTTIAFVGFGLQTVLYFLGALTGWRWIWPVTIFSLVCSILLIMLCLQADSTPFCAGANDNATGAGLVLTLAEQLKDQPLKNTRVWLVCSGCEEVQHYGAIEFFRRHREELHRPTAIAFEMLGCCGPAWLVKEGIVVPFYADRKLVSLAEKLAEEHPEWQAHATQINGGNTEMADALRIGIPAITLMGLSPKGEAPYWHMVSDTCDKMDEEVLERTYAFAWAYIQTLDSVN